MTLEEKAKAYDEAIKEIKDLIADNDGKISVTDLNDIFPELKESEDERMRKEIIECLKKNALGYPEQIRNKWISWIEKQGTKESKKTSIWNHWKDGIAGNGEGKLIYLIKNGDNYNLSSSLGYECDYVLLSDLDKLILQEKPTDNDEPRFKVGDWIISVCNSVAYVESISETKYNLRCIDGYHEKMSIEYVDRCWHPWEIQNAKPGDVLVDSKPFIFKKIDTNKYSYAYCGISADDDFRIESEGGLGEWTWRKDIKPATKEQRDFLFQKMREAGYEWDAEKKKLKKIE